MSFEVTGVDGVGPTALARQPDGTGVVDRRRPLVQGGRARDGRHLPEPSPPSEVLRGDGGAPAGRFDEMRAQRRELHFEMTEGTACVVEVRDLEGNVLRTIPPPRPSRSPAGRSIPESEHMAGISLSGLASGVDTTAVIAQLMAVEAHGHARRQQKRALEAREQALKDILSRLKNLKTMAKDLKRGRRGPTRRPPSLRQRQDHRQAPGRRRAGRPRDHGPQPGERRPAQLRLHAPARTPRRSITTSAGTTRRQRSPPAHGADGGRQDQRRRRLARSTRSSVGDDRASCSRAGRPAPTAAFTSRPLGASDVARQGYKAHGVDAKYSVDGGVIKQTAARTSSRTASPGIEFTLKRSIPGATPVTVNVSNPAPTTTRSRTRSGSSSSSTTRRST